MPNILFRADAEKTIGTGDLLSLVYISKEFLDNRWKCFFLVKDYQPAQQIIKALKLKNVKVIPRATNLKKEINFIKQICQKNAIDCLLMEINKRGLSEYTTLGMPAIVNACVNFDEKIPDNFDLVINWAIDQRDNLYDRFNLPNTKFLLGFENTPFPLSMRGRKDLMRNYNKEVTNILITMGGNDEFGMASKVTRALSQINSDFRITVIAGYGDEKYSKLFTGIKSKQLDIVLKKNVMNMFKEYVSCDLVISAGGLTAIELAASKTPALLIATYKHQIKRCEYLSKKMFAYFLGYHKNLTLKDIANGFEDLVANIDRYHNNLRNNSFEDGSKRIFNNINNLLASKKRRRV